MMYRNRMVFRDLIEVTNRKLTPTLHFGVIEEIALNPVARWGLGRTGPQLRYDAVNSDKLYFERIADENLIEEDAPSAWL